MVTRVGNKFVIFSCAAAKKGSVGKSKEELTLEKRRELERRLQDVSGQLNSVKKPAKPKGELTHPHSLCAWYLMHNTCTSESGLLTKECAPYNGYLQCAEKVPRNVL